jgi:hypothetical protein
VKVVLHPHADAEFLLAQQRYTDASPPLGRRFYDETPGKLLLNYVYVYAHYRIAASARFLEWNTRGLP